jgi:hypothetical protein
VRHVIYLEHCASYKRALRYSTAALPRLYTECYIQSLKVFVHGRCMTVAQPLAQVGEVLLEVPMLLVVGVVEGVMARHSSKVAVMVRSRKMLMGMTLL